MSDFDPAQSLQEPKVLSNQTVNFFVQKPNHLDLSSVPARDQSKEKVAGKRGRPSAKCGSKQQQSKVSQLGEPCTEDFKNFGGNLDASATKSAKPKSTTKDKVMATPSKSLMSFFKPIGTPKKPTEDVEMKEPTLVEIPEAEFGR